MNITVFDVSYWENMSTTLILSKNNDPKSEKICQDLITQYNIICPLNDVHIILTPYFDYDDHTTKHYCYRRYDTSILSSIIKRQDLMIRRGKEKNVNYGANVLLVIDDPNLSCDILNSDENLKYIMSNSRLLNITTIIRMPYEISNSDTKKILRNNNFSPHICSQLDYVIMFPIQNKESKHYKPYQQLCDRFVTYGRLGSLYIKK